MMAKGRNIIFVLVTLLAVSCMADVEHLDPMDNMTPEAGIYGSVVNEEGEPIEHIKVTLDWNDGDFQEVQYTDSDGAFHASLWTDGKESAKVLTVTLEDIDKEENKGFYAPYTETVTVFDTDTPINLDYRLILSTASENNPSI